MRSELSIFVAVLLAAGTAVAAPEIANVAGPVNHWEPFLVFGEGFDEPECTVIAWAPKEQQDPRELLPRILSGGLPQPPQEPPAGSVIGLYGRVRKLSPQVLGAVMQGEAAVLWVRSARGTSKPFAVNRPQPFFLEYESAAPARRSASSAATSAGYIPPGPIPACSWSPGPAARSSRPRAARNTTTRDTSITSWPMRSVYRLPADLPEGAYDVWVHHGAYGPYGFAGPLGLAIRSAAAPKKAVFDVTKHGAKGDGLADDTAAIEDALLAAAEKGGMVFLPAGTYLISRPLRSLARRSPQGREPGHHLPGRPAGEVSRRLPGGRTARETAGGGNRLPPRRRAADDLCGLRHHDLRPRAPRQRRDGFQHPLGVARRGRCITSRSPAASLFNPRTPLVTKEWLPAAAINTYGSGERIEISYCDLRALNGIGGGTRRCRTLYNTFSPPRGPYGTNQIGCQIGEECLIEGNVCREANRGFTCGPWGGPVQHNFLARNRFLDAGSVEGGGEKHPLRVRRSRRRELAGAPGGMRAGPRRAEGPEMAAARAQRANRDGCRRPGLRPGPHRADNSRNRVTLTEPWRIVPDAGSWIVVRQFAYQNVLLNNLCRDTLQGIQMSGAVDNVVDRFIGLRSGFGVWFPAFNAPHGERLYYSPSALNEVRNCIFSDTPNAVVFSGDRELAALRQPIPLTFGNLVRGNQFIHGEAKSYGGVIATSSWLAADDPRRQDAPPHAAFNAFGGNSFDPLAGKPAFNFDKSTFGSSFWLNKTGERPTAVPAQAAGSVVFPSP